jgi:hypothetical protein
VPRSPASRPGSLPGIRILYEVDEDAATVYVINVALTMRQATATIGIMYVSYESDHFPQVTGSVSSARR